MENNNVLTYIVIGLALYLIYDMYKNKIFSQGQSAAAAEQYATTHLSSSTSGFTEVSPQDEYTPQFNFGIA